MESLNKIEKSFLMVVLIIFILFTCLLAVYADGQRRILQAHQIIEISGAASDSEVEQIGAMYGIKPTLEKEYTLGEILAAGFRKPPSDVEIANTIAEIKTQQQ